MNSLTSSSSSGSTPKNGQSATTCTRRTLFPTSYTAKESKKKKDLTASFSPYVRCVKIDSYKDMTEEEIRLVWWQKSDYDGFARVSRIISKAMLEGGSEIWLMPHSTKSKLPSTPITSTSTSTANTDEVLGGSTKVPPTTTTTSSTTTTTMHNPKSIENFHKTRDKWWHKFGHSRRGLEHVASIMEGRQRHGNVRLAIKAVIEEQERQRLKLQLNSASTSTSNDPHQHSSPGTRSNKSRNNNTNFNCTLDSAKVRTVYLQHTHWARALARAAGESDADAVRTNFDDTQRKPREYYLRSFFAKMDGSTGSSSTTTTTATLTSSVTADRESMDLPHFMKIVLRINPNRFDDNTSTQLRLQRKKATGEVSSTDKASNSKSSSTNTAITTITTTATTTTTRAASCTTPLGIENEQKAANALPIMMQHNSSILPYMDPPEEKKCETDDETTTIAGTVSIVAHLQLESPLSPTRLAKKAAGWGVDNAEGKDMSAILTGMGTVS
jgi:hypothetical protein